jgi:hypothetical protein
MRAQGSLAAGHILHAHLKNDLRSHYPSVQYAAVFRILTLGTTKPCLLGPDLIRPGPSSLPLPVDKIILTHRDAPSMLH